MLILERKEGQDTLIGNDIIVSILEIRGRRVRIGIEAPKNIEIVRPEAVIKYKKVSFKSENYF